MFLDDTSHREVVYLGKAPSGDASTSPTAAKHRFWNVQMKICRKWLRY